MNVFFNDFFKKQRLTFVLKNDDDTYIFFIIFFLHMLILLIARFSMFQWDGIVSIKGLKIMKKDDNHFIDDHMILPSPSKRYGSQRQREHDVSRISKKPLRQYGVHQNKENNDLHNFLRKHIQDNDRRLIMDQNDMNIHSKYRPKEVEMKAEVKANRRSECKLMEDNNSCLNSPICQVKWGTHGEFIECEPKPSIWDWIVLGISIFIFMCLIICYLCKWREERQNQITREEQAEIESTLNPSFGKQLTNDEAKSILSSARTKKKQKSVDSREISKKSLDVFKSKLKHDDDKEKAPVLSTSLRTAPRAKPIIPIKNEPEILTSKKM